MNAAILFMHCKSDLWKIVQSKKSMQIFANIIYYKNHFKYTIYILRIFNFYAIL